MTPRLGIFSLCLSFFILLSAMVLAEEARTPQALFAQGAFDEAATLARAKGDADSLAFAAKALLTKSYSVPYGSSELADIEQAIEDAREAIQLDPKNVEGLVQLGVALGLAGLEKGTMKAFFSGTGQEVRSLFERANELKPDDPFILILLGGWHMEVARKNGSWVLGGSQEEGLQYLDRAVYLAPRNLLVRQYYAALLVATKNKQHQARASQLLLLTRDIEPRDFYEGVVKQKCEELMAALAEGDRKKAAQAGIRQIEFM